MPLLEALGFVDADRLAAKLLTTDVARGHLRHLGHIEPATEATDCSNTPAVILRHTSSAQRLQPAQVYLDHTHRYR